jgi:6-pyruvoyltetrahydropterin/6-carboxytetrahydropterin synthase
VNVHPPLRERLRFTAAARFHAARRLENAPRDDPARGLHGHGFLATVYADAITGVDFPGGEVEALAQRVAAVVAPLDYADLNAVVADPTDLELARHVAGALDAPGIASVGVASTALRGVRVGNEGATRTWHRFRFEAAHRLPHVPPSHKCGRMHGHGFEVVLLARSDVGYGRLRDAWSPMRALLDRACLNDVAGLENPTSEVLAAWLWHRLAASLPELERVTVFETSSCGAHFDGRTYRIWKEATLDSAVRLEHMPAGDPRRRVHGHTYRLRLHLDGPLDAVLGWAIDFGDVKERFRPLFEQLDHQPLFALPGLADGDCASLARWIRAAAEPLLPQLCRIDLEETPGHGVMLAWRG